MRETRRVPLRAALSGSAAVDNAHALKYDVKSLRVFLEPWVLTDGKDPKSACRDPRVAAARAARWQHVGETRLQRRATTTKPRGCTSSCRKARGIDH